MENKLDVRVLRTIKAQIVNFCDKHTCLIKSLALNIIFFVLMELLFEKVWTVDNAVITNTLYGAFGETYDYHANYTTFLYGKIVVFFLSLFPNLPWYTILESVWLFTAFTLLAYLIFKKHNNTFGMIINLIMLLFFTYEGYVCPQFTKTAAIIGTVGMFALLSNIKKWYIYVLGIILVVLGILIRSTSMLMTIGAWVVFLIIRFCYTLWRKTDIKKCIIESAVCLVVFLIYVAIGNYTGYEVVQEGWEEYNVWTDCRSRILDYDVPSYSEHIETYKEIGVSENDLFIWRSWNLDPAMMDVETMTPIIEMSLVESKGLLFKVFDVYNIQKFLKVFPLKLYTIDVFYALLLLYLVCFIGAQMSNTNKLGVGASFVICMLLNYYLFINDRYLHHRVDVGIVFLTCVLFIFWIDGEITSCCFKQKERIIGIVLCLLLCVPYKNYFDDISPISKDKQELNLSFFSETYKDKEHFYSFVTTRANAYENFAAFGKWDWVPVGFYRNIHGNTNPTPQILEVWNEYGISSPYIDAVDNNMMYIVIDEKAKEMENAIEVYIEENADKEVRLILVKRYMGKNIYRVNSKPLEEHVLFDEMIDDSDEMVGDTYAVISKKEAESFLQLKGNKYIKGKNDFAQNSYVEIIDSKTKETKIYNILQTENFDYEEYEEGYFSNISASIKLPKFYDETDQIYLVIEYDGVAYREKLVIDE